MASLPQVVQTELGWLSEAIEEHGHEKGIALQIDL
jgi:hypothetical protein